MFRRKAMIIFIISFSMILIAYNVWAQGNIDQPSPPQNLRIVDRAAYLPITIAWDPPTTNVDGSPLTDLAGYRVYYGTASRIYGSPIDVGNVTTYTLTGLPPGPTYFIAVTGYDTLINQSNFSNEVFVSPLGGPSSLINAIKNGDFSTGLLNWTFQDTSTTYPGCASVGMYASAQADTFNGMARIRAYSAYGTGWLSQTFQEVRPAEIQFYYRDGMDPAGYTPGCGRANIFFYHGNQEIFMYTATNFTHAMNQGTAARFLGDLHDLRVGTTIQEGIVKVIFDYSASAVQVWVNSNLETTFNLPSTVDVKIDRVALYSNLSCCDGRNDNYAIFDNVSVFEWGQPINKPPVANAGPDLTITLPETVTLNGSVTDDGLPNGTLNINWSIVSGPGTVNFSNPNVPVTSASFSRAGAYLLRLTANDGVLSSYDDTEVYVAKEVKKVIVIFAKFSQAPSSAMPIHTQNSSPSLSTFQREIASNINRYYVSSEASMGEIAFDFTFKDNSGEWYRLPNDYDYYTRKPWWEFWKDLVREFVSDSIEIADPDIDFSRYDSVIIVSPGSLSLIPGGRSAYLSPTVFHDFPTNEGPIKAIYLHEVAFYGTWAHELSHYLGMADLYADVWWYNLLISKGDVGSWSLMGTGNTISAPIDSYSRVSQGWLKPEYIPWVTIFSPEQEKTIRELIDLESGDSVPIYTDPLVYPSSYIFEARTDKVEPPLEGTKGIVIYKNEILSLENFDIANLDFLEAHGHGQNTWVPTLSPTYETLYIDAWEFVQFQYVEGSGDKYQPKVKITRPSISNLIGASITQDLREVFGSTLSTGNPSTANLEVIPDLDLHAYTPDGNHVGVNYVSGEYEIGIPGAIASGDQIYAREWIFVPLDIPVQFAVSSRDVEQFIRMYPDMANAEASLNCNFQVMVYGENPRVSAVEDKWLVEDRKLSNSFILTLKPGQETQVFLPITIHLDPRTLNLGSKGKFVTLYIEPPEGFNASDIDVATIRLNGSIRPLSQPIQIGDYDLDGIAELMLKFDRHAVASLCNSTSTPSDCLINISGKISGMEFKGVTTVRVISP